MSNPESPFAGVPSQIQELSSNLADFVERAVGIRPDFSPDTLSLVDHYATLARVQLKERPELEDLTAQALGAYFGEVVRRSSGAFWQVPTANFHDWRLCGVASFITINPIGVGYDALKESEEHKGPSSQFKLAPEDREAVQARLDNLPEVRDTDYFTLCTRLEVMEIVMDAIRGEASRRGYEDMQYTEDDYAADLRPLSAY